MRQLPLLALLACVTLFAACSDDTTGPDTNNGTGLYTISGKLRFDSAVTIPSTARVHVVWNVSSGSPDYAYIFGHGTVNLTTNTFTVVFDKEPPAEALNSYGLGVAAIALLPNSVPDGKVAHDSASIIEASTLGLAEDYGIIYLSKSPDSIGISWVKDFKQGFNTGKGVRKDQGFDEFTPTEPNLIEIVIDAVKNLEWINWT
jgi:hypothetical protein